MHHEETKESIPMVLPPRTAFLAGAAAGALILSSIGFFVLLAIVLRGN